MLLLFAQVMGQRGDAHSSYPRALALTLTAKSQEESQAGGRAGQRLKGSLLSRANRHPCALVI